MTTGPRPHSRLQWPRRLPRPPWLLIPFPVAFAHLMGIRGAAVWRDKGGNFGPPHHPDVADVGVSPVAIVLALIGPAALFAMRAYPRSVLAVSALAAVTYYSLGYPPGPVFIAPLVALVAWVRMVRRERLAQLSRVRDAERRRESDAERLRIAQELHDLLAHHISLINVQSGVALHLADQRPEQTKEALTAIKGASAEALTALRGALDALRGGADSAPRAPTSGLAQLDALAESVRQAGVTVSVHIEGEETRLEPAVDLAALRIIQESLTNVLRHADARHVEVRVVYGEELEVSVTDDGTGGVPVPGNGLTGMRERAAANGGTFWAGPAAGGGFEVRARLPR